MRVLCHEKAKRLANATCATAHANLEVSLPALRRRNSGRRQLARCGQLHLLQWLLVLAGQGSRLGICKTCIDLLFQLSESLPVAPLLVLAHGPQGVHLLHTLHTEGHLGGQVGQVLPGTSHHISALRGLLASETAQHRVAELRPRISHGEGGRALATLRIHHIGARILHMLVHVRHLVRGHAIHRRHLREQRQNGDTCMPSHHGDIDRLQANLRRLMHELVRTHDVQARDTADLARVEACLLVELAHGGHDGIDRIHDETEHGIGAELRAGLHDVLRDASIRAQEISPSHARLARQARGHQDEVAARKALLQLLDGLVRQLEGVARHLRLPLDVRQVGSDTGRGHHRNGQVEDTQLTHMLVGRHQHA